MRATSFLVVLTIGVQQAAAQATTSTSTNSTSHTETVHTTYTPERVDAFGTRLTARIGSGPLLYDKTITGPLSDPAAQAAIQQARDQLSAAAAPATLSFSGPNLVSSTVTRVLTKQETVFNKLQMTTDVATITTFGPATIRIGELGLCSGLTGTAPTRIPTGCTAGTPFAVAAGTMNVNTNTNTQIDYFQTIYTIDFFGTLNVYELVGTVPGTPPATPAPPSLILASIGVACAGLWRLKRKLATPR